MKRASSLSPARQFAYRVLHRVARTKADPATLLHGKRGHELRALDRDLATELVYGVLRWQNRLDYSLEALAGRAKDRMDLPVLLALRIGLYQIRFLARVPERTAVDEAVKTARRYGPRGAPGFVNAVLRAACRRPGFPVLPTKRDDPLDYLTVTLSHPQWLARRYLERLGVDGAEARCQYNNRQPPTDIRVEPGTDLETARGELAREGIAAERFPGVPHCLRASTGSPARSTLRRSAKIFIQEAGSQLIPHLLGIQPGDRVLDACAAPGAKATEMAAWCSPGIVIALERRLRRVFLMASLARRFGRENVLPVAADAAEPPLETRTTFCGILLDAPCSNLGTLARNPDIKWRMRESDLAGFGTGQLRLLESCSRHLAARGRLVYATCSTEPEENDDVIATFLQDHPELHICPPPPSFPDEARRFIDDRGVLRIFPERDGMDGYFAVILERNP